MPSGIMGLWHTKEIYTGALGENGVPRMVFLDSGTMPNEAIPQRSHYAIGKVNLVILLRLLESLRPSSCVLTEAAAGEALESLERRLSKHQPPALVRDVSDIESRPHCILCKRREV